MKLPLNETTTFKAGDLPAGVDIFTVRQLAKIFRTSSQHWINQIECGQLAAVDLRTPGTTKSMLRIPRAALVKLLDKQAT